MTTQDLIINKFGDLNNPDKYILQIPTECCGTKIEVNQPNKKYGVNSICAGCVHYTRYSFPDIWNMFAATAVPYIAGEKLMLTQKSSCVCFCGNHNEYAQPNQSDGSYKCYNCRNI